PKKGWKLRPLKELVLKTKGKLVRFSKEGKEPVIDMNYFTTGSFENFSDDMGVKATVNDILLLWDGAGAGTPITNVAGIVGSTFAKLMCKADISSNFLYYFLLSVKSKNMNFREGSGVPHVPKDYLEMQKVNLPPKETQEKIASVLTKADENINLQKQKLQKLKLQQKAMMQLLLTGIVRV
ncbi:MAG: restriction endonuclease subunit S, partial [Anaerovoracaceae bacterium]